MKKTNPSICIIVPVYKIKKEYLDQCINSLISQTYQNIKIILVDDKSPDESGRWCDEYAEKDERIKVLHNIRNLGVSESRNRALAEADCDYITFVDADDWLDKQCLEKVIEKAAKETDDPDVIIFQESLAYVDKDIPQIALARRWEGREALNELQQLALSFVFRDSEKRSIAIDNIAGKLISLQVIRENDLRLPAIPYREDGVFFQELIECAGLVIEVPAGVYHYRMRTGSAVNSFKEHAPKDQRDLLMMHWRFAVKHRKNADYRHALYGFSLVPMQMAITTFFFNKDNTWSFIKKHRMCSTYFKQMPYINVFSNIKLSELTGSFWLKAFLIRHRFFFAVKLLRDIYMKTNKLILFE